MDASLRTVVLRQTNVVKPPWRVTIARGCCKTKMLMMGELSCNGVHKRKEAFGKCKAISTCLSTRPNVGRETSVRVRAHAALLTLMASAARGIDVFKVIEGRGICCSGVEARRCMLDINALCSG